jgi:L-alanine-DL-glutamate epimerase-like enolase superfamily enzyme
VREEAVRIVEVKPHPLAAPIAPDIQRTSAGNYPTISILVVEVITDQGITGWGEGLLRAAPAAAATLVEQTLKPLLLGADPFTVEALWPKLARATTGRSGGVLIETVAAIDIALWDIMGKVLGQPVHRLLGTCGRARVTAYASSISWGPLAIAEAQAEDAVRRGFPLIKVKIGAPVEAAIERMRVLTRLVDGRAKLCADANWAFDYDDAVRLARALLELDVHWLEEPIVPEDLDGYRRLRAAAPIRLAAGESEFTAWGARDLIASRAVGVIQPDVARSGGITETRRIATLAHCFHLAYAPHMGFSGAVCAAASLHLAAAMPNFATFECMIFPNPLREQLATSRPGDPSLLEDGTLPVPEGPGLGIEIDRAALARLTVA